VSIFRVQSRGPIRSCNNNITMTTHSLNVGRKLCGSRRLCVCEKLIPKIANLRQSGLTSMPVCCLWGAQNRCVICNETVVLVKSGNVKRHYETKHAHFEQKYPQNSEGIPSNMQSNS